MSSRKRWPLQAGEALAGVLCRKLAPFCERIEIAGSIRRQCPTIGDVELVLMPRTEERIVPGQGSLFAPPETRQVNLAWEELDRLTARGKLSEPSRGGQRMRSYPAVRGDCRKMNRIPMDIFCVVDPRSWGVLLAIRTGPTDFGARCMQRLRNRKLRCEGALVHGYLGDVIPCFEETDFFEACGLQWIRPENRR